MYLFRRCVLVEKEVAGIVSTSAKGKVMSIPPLKDWKPGDPPVALVCSERLFPALQQATPPQSHVAHWDGDAAKDLCLLEVEEEQLHDIMEGRRVGPLQPNDFCRPRRL